MLYLFFINTPCELVLSGFKSFHRPNHQFQRLLIEIIKEYEASGQNDKAIGVWTENSIFLFARGRLKTLEEEAEEEDSGGGLSG